MALITKMLGIAVSDCGAKRITTEQLLSVFQEAINNGDILEEENEFVVAVQVLPLIDEGVLQRSKHVDAFDLRMKAKAIAEARGHRTARSNMKSLERESNETHRELKLHKRILQINGFILFLIGIGVLSSDYPWTVRLIGGVLVLWTFVAAMLTLG